MCAATALLVACGDTVTATASPAAPGAPTPAPAPAPAPAPTPAPVPPPAPPPAAATYSLTVASGTGGGTYKAGAYVGIRANPPAAGKVFDRWVITSGAPFISNASAAAAVLTVPAGNVAIAATYKDQSRVPVTVNSVGGYQGATTASYVPDQYSGGFSMYVAAWPFQANYPGRRSQTGLYGTWMSAASGVPLYTTIEGGLGWWQNTRFATETPKFGIGAVSNFFEDIGSGPWHGVAQISPWLVWPLDHLNLKEGTAGELFGYGYLPLPFTEPKSTTAGVNVVTGNHAWTLFLNTANFKGPVGFVVPYFFSKASIKNPTFNGQSLDTKGAVPGGSIAMETADTPAVQVTLANGRTYARIAPLLFPADADDRSTLIHNVYYYDKSALWDSVTNWFAGGAPASGVIGGASGTGTFRMGLTGHGDQWAIWSDQPSMLNGQRDTKIPWSGLRTAVRTDGYTLVLEWNRALVQKASIRGKSYNVFPEYFVWDATAKAWQPIGAADVPDETGLRTYTFANPDRAPDPITTPDAPDSVWKKPGPVAGPFYAYLGDGSKLTYYWYRFADQPVMLEADLTPAEREAVQKRVEAIHRAWTKDRNYLPPPTIAKPLAAIDPALIVQPPPGLEVGYVPVATRQELAR